MAAVNLRLGAVSWDNTYKDVLYFTSESAQTSYFMDTLTLHSRGDSTFQRIGNVVRYPENIENLRDVNYCAVQNEWYSARWYYCFITDMKYINDGMTELTIELDVYQTWMFETTLKTSFVEREHVSDDTRGANLIDEGLELGDYICDTGITPVELGEMVVVFATSAATDGARTTGTNVCGVFNSWELHAFHIDTEHTEINSFINGYDTAGHADAIQCAFMIPACAVDIDANTHAVTTVNISKINMVGYSCLEDGVLNYSDFTPKNNKLLTYPYIFLHGTNFEGQTNDYHYEYFSNLSNLLFMFACNISMSPTAILWPVNYKGVVDNYDEGITLQNFPQCPWTSDFFKNWFVQNCVSTITGAAASGVSLAAGAMTANPVAVAGGVIEAANVMGEIAKHAVVPANARGNGGDGSLQIALGTKGVGFGKFRIRKEYAQKIDNFFEMYGYKVNNVKVPNVNSRPYWNYVKTIDCNITGDIPNKDMQKLKSIYNAGVTIWHGATNMYNYSLNNH